MTIFDKPALTVAEQVELLRARGLDFDNTQASECLQQVGYYRLSAYMRPFYQMPLEAHQFRAGATFEQVWRLYAFDRELRLLILDAVERIEVALRAQLANCLAEHHGPHGYVDAAVFDTRYNHHWLIQRLGKELGNSSSDEAFVQHYQQKYADQQPLPPIWMAMELLTFKEVSVLLSNLRHSKDTQRLQTQFGGWPFEVLKSWFHAVSNLRNACAHHARIWNREFGNKPKIPRKHRADSISPIWPDTHQHGRLYGQLVVVQALMRVVSPKSQWAHRLQTLLTTHSDVPLAQMGFPPDWDQQAFWQSRPLPTSPAHRPTVLVTGAGKRLGRQIALTLAQQGWNVAVHHRHSKDDAIDTVAACVTLSGGTGDFCAEYADLSDEASVRALWRAVVAHYGRVDAVVNSASTFEHDDAQHFSYAMLDKHLHANTAAAIVLAQCLHAHRRGSHLSSDTPPAVVVNLLDQKLWNPNPDFFSYTLSKAALEAANTLLAQALAPLVRVVGVAPGLTLTSHMLSEAEFQALHRLSPLGRSSTPDDVAATVAFALSNRSITGTTLLVDGGQHLMRFERDFSLMPSTQTPPPSSSV